MSGPAPHAGGLWRNGAFLTLWTGQTIALVGAQVTLLALPLTAILALGATPAQVGLLSAVEYAPFLVVGLVAGVWTDRLRRRPILIWANLGRAALLGTIPLAALLGRLHLAQLYIVGLLVSTLAVFFEVAYQSYLPTLVARGDLVEGNSKLEVSRSAAQIAGPGLAGALVQVASAPLAIAANTASFLVSALLLGLIRAPETPRPAARRRGAWAAAGEGLRVVAGHPILRAIAASAGTYNLFAHVFLPLFALYATRELGVAPALLGAVLAIGSGGFLAGALLAGPVVRRAGLGAALLAVPVVSGGGVLLIAAAGGPRPLIVLLLALGQFLYAAGGTVFNVNSVSLRQAVTPDRLLGRVNATMRVIAYGAIPLGSLLGGGIAEWAGVRPTFVVAGLGVLCAAGWIVASPVRVLQRTPALLEDVRGA